MPIPSLDTNCVLRLLVRENPAQTAQMDVLMAGHQQLRIPDAALLETIYVLGSFYKFSRADIADSIHLLLVQSNLELDRELWSHILDVYVQMPKLSVTDIYLTFDAQRHNATPLLSFDRKLIAQLGAKEP